VYVWEEGGEGVPHEGIDTNCSLLGTEARGGSRRLSPETSLIVFAGSVLPWGHGGRRKELRSGAPAGGG